MHNTGIEVNCGVANVAPKLYNAVMDTPPSPDAIEITPEMIEAALPILFDYDPKYSNERDIVAEIYEAMSRARYPRISSPPLLR